jgi:CubicO group peptidase (beta-lactamase class C family)
VTPLGSVKIQQFQSCEANYQGAHFDAGSQPASIELMMSDHLPEAVQEQAAKGPLAGMGVGLGVAIVKDPAKTGRLGAVGDAGWGGHYDTQFFISPRYAISAVILTQLQPHPDAPSTDTMAQFKTQVLASVEN